MKRNTWTRVVGAAGSLALLVLLPTGCVERRVVAPTPVPVEHLTPAGAGTFTGLTEPLRVAVRDPVEFEKLWKMAWTYQPAPPVPSVDFGTHRVLVVAMGQQGSGGFGIRVADVFRAGGGLEARVRLTVPGKGCAVPTVLTQPADFVSVPVRTAMVQFEDNRQAIDCN